MVESNSGVANDRSDGVSLQLYNPMGTTNAVAPDATTLKNLFLSICVMLSYNVICKIVLQVELILDDNSFGSHSFTFRVVAFVLILNSLSSGARVHLSGQLVFK